MKYLYFNSLKVALDLRIQSHYYINEQQLQIWELFERDLQAINKNISIHITI